MPKVEACFRVLTGGRGGTIGLDGLRKAAKVGEIRGEGGVDQALKQVLQRHAGAAAGSGREVSRAWRLIMPPWLLPCVTACFVGLYRDLLKNFRKAMGLCAML